MSTTAKPEIPLEIVLELHALFLQHNIQIWIDGGWGVDALVGYQTRPHKDFDIALRHSNVARLRALLVERGFKDIPRDDTSDCNFLLGNSQGHRVDVHSFELDGEGNTSFGLVYRAEHLTGTGIIGGQPVHCISPEWAVQFHAGYPLRETDFIDVKLLCETFGIEMPEEHKTYWLSKQQR